MTILNEIENRLKYLGNDLVKEILEFGIVKIFPANTELVREGQYVKVIPIVLKGLIKVFTVRRQATSVVLHSTRTKLHNVVLISNTSRQE